MGNDRSVSEDVCRNPSALLSPVFFDAGCGMLVGSFLLSVFFFLSCHTPFHVYLLCYFHTHQVFSCICVIIGWVCLTTARVLCSPSDLYMPVHPMCNNHCIAFDVSPPLWLSLRLAFCQPWLFWKSTSCDNIKNELSYYIKSKIWKKNISASTLFKVIKSSLQSFGKT